MMAQAHLLPAGALFCSRHQLHAGGDTFSWGRCRCSCSIYGSSCACLCPTMQHGASAGSSAAICSGARGLAGVRLELVSTTITAQVRARGDRKLLSRVFRDRELHRTSHAFRTPFLSERWCRLSWFTWDIACHI